MEAEEEAQDSETPSVTAPALVVSGFSLFVALPSRVVVPIERGNTHDYQFKQNGSPCSLRPRHGTWILTGHGALTPDQSTCL